MDTLSENFFQFLKSWGVDPLEFGTFLTLLFVAFDFKDMKRWHAIDGHRKFQIAAEVFGASVFLFFTILRILGILKL
jgi:hypothetical protein